MNEFNLSTIAAIITDQETRNGLQKFLGKPNSEDEIQRLFYKKLCDYQSQNIHERPKPENGKNKCKYSRNDKAYDEKNDFCVPEKIDNKANIYKSQKCRHDVDESGWYREVDPDLKTCCEGYTGSKIVDFAEIYVSKEEKYLRNIVELKVFKNIKSHDGHEYPLITKRGGTEWNCFVLHEGTSIITDSDEGVLFYDLLKMTSLKKTKGNDARMFQIIIIHLDDTREMLYSIIEALYEKFIAIAEVHDIKVHKYTDCKEHVFNIDFKKIEFSNEDLEKPQITTLQLTENTTVVIAEH